MNAYNLNTAAAFPLYTNRCGVDTIIGSRCHMPHCERKKKRATTAILGCGGDSAHDDKNQRMGNDAWSKCCLGCGHTGETTRLGKLSKYRQIGFSHQVIVIS